MESCEERMRRDEKHMPPGNPQIPIPGSERTRTGAQVVDFYHARWRAACHLSETVRVRRVPAHGLTTDHHHRLVLSRSNSIMAPLADAILKYVPLPNVPSYLTRWEPGVTPLSTQKEVVAALVSYLTVIFGIQHIMRDKQPVRANGPFQVHNTFLYLGSGLLLALIVEEIVPLIFKGGLFYGMCNNDAWTSVSIDYVNFSSTLKLMVHSAPRVLLYDQLLLQVCGAHRYCIPRNQEEKARLVKLVELDLYRDAKT
jgi:hypothetical protein